MIYPDFWKYWYVTWRDLEYRKLDKQISVDVGKYYRTWISKKTWKRKVLEELVSLQWKVVSSYTDVYLMFYMLRTCVRVVLLLCFYLLCLVLFLYSSRDFPYWLHIIFLRMLFCFLIVIRYIVVDTNPLFFLKSLLYVLQMSVSCSIFPVLELAYIMFFFTEFWIFLI